MSVLRTATLTCLALFVFACSPASMQPIPRLERYDFIDQTPNDLVRLRQIAPSEDEEGVVARYALARAHADWLVLGLADIHEGDMLLRRLAVDLEIEGASLDDQLNLEQVLACMERVLLEIQAGSDAGGEAREWSRGMEHLLEALRDGWERFSPELFRAVVEVASEEGSARLAADLLAIGWATVAVNAVGDRPEPERATFLVRMAGYFDIDEVEAIEEGRGHLWERGLAPTCPAVQRQLADLGPHEQVALVRRSCTGEELGVSGEINHLLSAELTAGTRVIRDLLERRQRLEGFQEDPLRIAGEEVLTQFDNALSSFRLTLPPPAPGPGVPTPPVVQSSGPWRATAGVVIVEPTGEPTIAMWPALAVIDGSMQLVDVTAGLSVPGRSTEPSFQDAAEAVFQQSRERLGDDSRSLTILIDGNTPSERLVEALERCEEVEPRSILLIVFTTDGGFASIPVAVDRGAARNRTSSERRAVLVLADEGLQLGNADGQWAEFQREEASLPTDRLEAAFAEHVRGRGNAGVIVAVRPGSTVSDVAVVLDFLSRLPRAAAEDAAHGWQAWLDPEEPPAPTPVAETAAGAVSNHRVRLRSCYERYLRGGGLAQGMLVLELSVDGDGEVASARVATTELGPQPSLDNCLIGEAQRIRFPENTDASVIRVPLRFVPEGSSGPQR